jgi:transcriptional regulator GlxA family with amidase domain
MAHILAPERPNEVEQLHLGFAAALEAVGHLALHAREEVLHHGVRAWLMGHLHQDLLLEEMAGRVSLSPRQFSRVFTVTFTLKAI